MSDMCDKSSDTTPQDPAVSCLKIYHTYPTYPKVSQGHRRVLEQNHGRIQDAQATFQGGLSAENWAAHRCKSATETDAVYFEHHKDIQRFCLIVNLFEKF